MDCHPGCGLIIAGCMDSNPTPCRILPEKRGGNQKQMRQALGSLLNAFCAWRQPPKMSPAPVVKRGESTTLVVVLHAYTHEAADMEGICQVVTAALPDADLLVPEMPFDVFSMAKLEDVCTSVKELIDEQWKKGCYKKLIICGHSMGALVARKICLLGWADGNENRWGPAIQRVVLFAPFNRGWKATNHTAKSTLLVFWVGGVISWKIKQVRGRRPLVYDIAEGAVFLNNLRLEWQEMRRSPGCRWPVIQLMASRDDLVAPSDTVDPAAADDDYRVLEVPDTSHADIVKTDAHEPGLTIEESRIRRRRAEVIRKAFIEGMDDLKLLQAQLGEEFQPWKHDSERLKVTDVAYVIHGIRDEGWWTARIAGKIKHLGDALTGEGEKKPRFFATETSSYGYFPMLPFALPGRRLAKMGWLVDQYVENLARYPNAERFHFVGHSNGTYMMAAALKHHPKMKFDHVVFAGSVVNNDYPWAEKIAESGQVKKVLNYVATDDVVVALFPKGLGRVSGVGEGLGSAGHDGFHVPESAEAVRQVRYAEGGHGAALEEPHWQGICDFIVKGVYPPSHQCDRGVTWAVWLGRYQRALLLGIIVVLLCIGSLVWRLPDVAARLPFPVMAGNFSQAGVNLGVTAMTMLVMMTALVGIICLMPEKVKVAPVKKKSPPRPWLTLAAVAGGLALLMGCMWALLRFTCPQQWAMMHPEPVEWLRILSLLGYLWVLKTVVTKV